MCDIYNNDDKAVKISSDKLSPIIDWVSINRRYIAILKELVALLSVANPAYLYIKKKFDENLKFWSPTDMEKIRGLLNKSITWQKKTIKEQRKYLCYAEKVQNSAIRNISTDKNGKTFISQRNLPKLMRIIEIDRDHNLKFKRANKYNILYGIKEYNNDIIAKFDSIYENCMQKKLLTK